MWPQNQIARARVSIHILGRCTSPFQTWSRARGAVLLRTANVLGGARLGGVNPIGQRFGFWLFLLTGVALPGFDPEKDGMKGIKKLVRRRFPNVRQLSPTELSAWLADPNRPQPRVLDVRRPDEFSLSRLPGARRVDRNEKVANLRDPAATDRPVVVYCSVGYRSSKLASRLIKAGMMNVFNLEGSIFQWANEGRPLVNSNGPAVKVHPYSRRWRALLKPRVRGAASSG